MEITTAPTHKTKGIAIDEGSVTIIRHRDQGLTAWSGPEHLEFTQREKVIRTQIHLEFTFHFFHQLWLRT